MEWSLTWSTGYIDVAWDIGILRINPEPVMRDSHAAGRRPAIFWRETLEMHRQHNTVAATRDGHRVTLFLSLVQYLSPTSCNYITLMKSIIFFYHPNAVGIMLDV